MSLPFDATFALCNGDCDNCTIDCEMLRDGWFPNDSEPKKHIRVHKLSDRRYVSYFDKDFEGGETVEICGYKRFRQNGYGKEELYKIICLRVGEVAHFMNHPMINMEHHFIMRVMDCGGF